MEHKENDDILIWPEESVPSRESAVKWQDPGSNICLDFHGDPVRPQLAVFSDGNHHMALQEALDLFVAQKPGLERVFYATTPPGPIVKLLKTGALKLGNLVISTVPDVFISPPHILNDLVQEGYMNSHQPFIRNQGNVLLVRKGNPRGISGIQDLDRPGVCIFLSNPETERASYSAYISTLRSLAEDRGMDPGFVDKKREAGEVVFGRCVHHREAPRAVAVGKADAAIVFYHLGLRYIRIFPDTFHLVPLGGSPEHPRPWPGNVTGATHMGTVGQGGAWGEELISFLSSESALDIYRYHGLLPAES